MDGEPPQEEDFSQIPLVERSQHKNWKARLSAYTDVIAKSAKTASDNDPFFRPYTSDGSLLKKWCLDANAVAQEKGVEAVLAIVTYSGETSAKTRSEVVPGLVEKALGNTRAGTKRKGADLCAMYVEVENGGEGVVADVLVGLDSKQPKVVAGNVACLKELVEAFGVTTLGNVKLLLKALPKIFAHSDKTVRAEGTSLTLALYSYLGPALLPALSELKPVQMTELQKSFDLLDAEGKGAGTGKPTRYTRKVQRERESAQAAGETGAVDGERQETDGAEEPIAVDPMSLLDPVDAISKFPSDLMERLSSTKWKDRLEALEECNKFLDQPQNKRISDSNVDAYASLVQTLGNKCKSDANVNVVIEAAKLLENLATGLGKAFGRFKAVTLSECLERLKERKANVVEALSKALDAIFLSTTINDIAEDVLTASKSKNPQVKEGALKFLHRSLQTTTIAPSKDQIKPLAEGLVSALGDSAESVRTSAAECLGTMMKILGERAFNPYVEEVAELQMTKVKDAFGRAEIKYRPGSGGGSGNSKPAAPKSAAVKPATARPTALVKKAQDSPTSPLIKGSGKFNMDLLDEMAPPTKAPPARFARPNTATGSTSSPPEPILATRTAVPPARPAPAPGNSSSKPTTASKPNGGASKILAVSPSEPVKYRFTPEEAAAQAETSIPTDYHTKLADPAWKVRLEAAEEMVKWVGEDGGADSVDSEVMMRFLSKTPGWGEKNFQVSGKLYQVMAIMAEKSPTFGKPAAALIIGHLTDKLGDLKLKKPSGDALTAIAERTSLAFVLAQSYEPMSKQKAPKALADALTWIKQQVIEFGIAGIPLRDLISFVKTALGNPNALVRSSATQLLVQVKIFVGADISGFIEDLNPQLLSTINSEFDKAAGQTPPEPIRQQADLKEVASAPGKSSKNGAGSDPLDDLIPRVDLDKLVASTSVITDSRSEAWKVRKEAFEALNAVLDIKSNSRLKPNMGEIASVLKKATADTNLAVKMLALGIISKIANGMGTPFEKYSRLLVAPVAAVCADQKTTTRSAALSTLSSIAEACGSLDSMYAGLATSLESTNPALRASVLGWIAEKLTSDYTPSSNSDLSPLAAPIITCLEDRTAEVRKAAGLILAFVVASAGYDYVMDQTSRLKPASKSTIIPLINNARGAIQTQQQGGGSNSATSSSSTTGGGAAKVARPVTKTITVPSSPRPGGGVASVRPGGAAGTGIAPARSLAMKALSSNAPASSIRPPSTTSSNDDRPSGLPKPRVPGSRPVSAAPPTTSITSANFSSSTHLASSPSLPPSRTIPFTTASSDARIARAKKDATRWTLDPGSKTDMLEYLQIQMEPHVSKEIMELLFSKDHKAEEDYMAALSVMAEFYDETTSASFGLGSGDDLVVVQLANVDLALKYSAIRLLSNNTQLAIRSLEVISKVVETLPKHNERFSDGDAKLFVPALVIKLGDAKFGPKLVPVFEMLDRLMAASQVVQLLLHYGLEDKSAGKTCKNESLALIERAYRKRGSILRSKDDKGLYEAVAKCISDSGTRNAALSVMALLQLQGESKALHAVIEAMPASSKDMLANRRATMAAAKTGPSAGTGIVAPNARADGIVGSPSPPRAKTVATPGRLGATPRAGTTSASSSRPSSATPRAAAPSLSGLSRPAGVGATSRLHSLRPTESVIPAKPSLQPLGRASMALNHGINPEVQAEMDDEVNGHQVLQAPVSNATASRASIAARPTSSNRPLPIIGGGLRAESVIEGIRAKDRTLRLDGLRKLQEVLIEQPNLLRYHLRPLVEALTETMAEAFDPPENLLDPEGYRIIKHTASAATCLCVESDLIVPIDYDTLWMLLWSLTRHLVQVDMVQGGDLQQLSKFFNGVLLAALAKPDRFLVYQVMLRMLLEMIKNFEIGNPTIDSIEAHHADLVLKCLWKRCKLLDDDLRQNRVSPGPILQLIEEFLTPVGPTEYRQRQSDGVALGELPLRTAKTMLQRLVVWTKETDQEVYEILLSQFGDSAADTIVYTYLFRIANQVSDRPAPRSNATLASQAGQLRSRQTSATSTVATNNSAPNSPPKILSEAERLVVSLKSDSRPENLDLVYAYMKKSPESAAEVNAAIQSHLTQTVQLYVIRMLHQRSNADQPPSPVRSPLRESHTSILPPTSISSSSVPSSSSSSAVNRPVPAVRRSTARPSTVIVDKSIPLDEQMRQLKAVFQQRQPLGMATHDNDGERVGLGVGLTIGNESNGHGNGAAGVESDDR